MNAPTSWPEDRAAELRAFYDKGMTYLAIANEFGCSRNAIAGACRRLGFPHRMDPDREPSRRTIERRRQEANRAAGITRQYTRRQPRPPIIRVTKTYVRPKPVDEPTPLNLSLEELHYEKQCHWSVSDGSPHKFCGAPATGGWCDHHRGRVYYIPSGR